MSKHSKLRVSPAMVVAVVALVVALAGTAIAAVGLSGKEKKQVGKIATKVFGRRISGASVSHAMSADSATKATTASTAAKATTASTATKADSATSADKATNAQQLGGRPAGDYQVKLQGSCSPPTAIEAIGQDGAVACSSTQVQAIDTTPSTGNATSLDLGSGLQLTSVCHDGGTEVAFQNIGSAAATLNWFYSNGSAVSANGANLNGGAEQDFDLLGARIEGQFIYSLGATVITVSLHAYDGTSFCEVRGTAVSASS